MAEERCTLPATVDRWRGRTNDLVTECRAECGLLTLRVGKPAKSVCSPTKDRETTSLASFAVISNTWFSFAQFQMKYKNMEYHV